MHIKHTLPQAPQLGKQCCCTSSRDLFKDTLLRIEGGKKPGIWRDLNPQHLCFEWVLYSCATNAASVKSGIDKLSACPDEKNAVGRFAFPRKSQVNPVALRVPREPLKKKWMSPKKIIIIDHVSEDRQRSGLKNLILICFTFSLADICHTSKSVKKNSKNLLMWVK